MFKIGDKVRLIPDEDGQEGLRQLHQSGIKAEIGDVFTVQNIPDEGDPWGEKWDHDAGLIGCKEWGEYVADKMLYWWRFELVKEEKVKYKPGDRVRILTCNTDPVTREILPGGIIADGGVIGNIYILREYNEQGDWWMGAFEDYFPVQQWVFNEKAFEMADVKIEKKKQVKKKIKKPPVPKSARAELKKLPRGGVCSYLHLYENGFMIRNNNDVCHARLNVGHGGKVLKELAFNYEAQYKRLTGTQQKNFKEFFKYLLSSFFGCGFKKAPLSHVIRYGLLGDVENRTVSEIATSAVASRIPTEFPQICELFIKLKKEKGIDPDVAFLFAHMFGYTKPDKDGYNLYCYGGHQIFISSMSTEGLVTTLKDKKLIRINQNPYIQSGHGYRIYESIATTYAGADKQIASWIKNNLVGKEIGGAWDKVYRYPYKSIVEGMHKFQELMKD